MSHGRPPDGQGITFYIMDHLLRIHKGTQSH